MERRKRLADGSFGELENIGSDVSLYEQIELLGMQLAFEKISNMQSHVEKDALMDALGEQLVQVRLELLAMKGGEA